MTEIKVGDEVRVFYQRRSLRAQNPEGLLGKVIRVGKKYGMAQFEQGGEVRFDLETGFQSPNTEGLRVRTLEQAERDERRKVALFHLDNAGIEFKLGRAHFFTLEQLEALAEVVKTWDQEGWLPWTTSRRGRSRT